MHNGENREAASLETMLQSDNLTRLYPFGEENDCFRGGDLGLRQ